MSEAKVLKALKAYGDDWLDVDDHALSKRRSKRNDGENNAHRKSLTEMGETKNVSRKLRELNKIKEELGLIESEVKETAEAQSEHQQKTDTKGPVVVVFQGRKSTKRKPISAIADDDEEAMGREGQEEGFRKVKFDVMKFGIRGLERPKQEEAKIALAVQLGAKPPNNKYINYKQFIAERKQEKVLAREQKILNAKMGAKPKTKGPTSKKAKKKRANSKKSSTCKEFHDGIKYVSKQLIAKVKKSSGRRK